MFPKFKTACHEFESDFGFQFVSLHKFSLACQFLMSWLPSQLPIVMVMLEDIKLFFSPVKSIQITPANCCDS